MTRECYLTHYIEVILQNALASAKATTSRWSPNRKLGAPELAGGSAHCCFVAQRLSFMSRGRVRLPTEAGDLYPNALQEAGKLGGSFELGYRIERFERRREGVREAPECSRFELRVRRPEVQVMDLPGQVLWSV